MTFKKKTLLLHFNRFLKIFNNQNNKKKMLNTQAPQSNSFLTGNFNISLNNDVNTQSLSVVESNNKEASPVIDTTTPQTNSTTTTHEQTKSKIELYMNALVHSTQCTSDSCTFAKCLQFKRVTRHNQVTISTLRIIKKDVKKIRFKKYLESDAVNDC